MLSGNVRTFLALVLLFFTKKAQFLARPQTLSGKKNKNEEERTYNRLPLLLPVFSLSESFRSIPTCPARDLLPRRKNEQ